MIHPWIVEQDLGTMRHEHRKRPTRMLQLQGIVLTVAVALQPRQLRQIRPGRVCVVGERAANCWDARSQRRRRQPADSGRLWVHQRLEAIPFSSR